MNLIIKFTDESESFTLGVELGLLLSKMEQGNDFIRNNNLPIHTKNIEVIKTACNYYGYTPIFKQSEYNDWTYFVAEKNYKNN